MKAFSRSLALAGLLAAVAIAPMFHQQTDRVPDILMLESASAYHDDPDGVLCITKKLILPKKKKEENSTSIHHILARYGE